MQKTIAKINLKAIEENARAFKARTNTKLCAVVKANAYGHGAENTVLALNGVADMFAVALVEEAKDIAVAACGTPILVFTPPRGEEIDEMIRHGFLLSVVGYRHAKDIVERAEKLKQPTRVHLKINTGMNRYGMNLQTLTRVCKLFASCPYIFPEGIYSHLYTDSEGEACAQRERFLKAVRRAKKYFPNLTAHLSATYGALLGEKYAFDMVRIGLGLYGYLPAGVSRRIPLKKAMKVYAPVMQTRKYSFGGAGYGNPKEERQSGLKSLSVLRVGYADGFFRNADWETASPVTSLCMDVCVASGKKQGLQPVMTDADEAARRAGTIAYEILCSATRRAEFVYEYR